MKNIILALFAIFLSIQLNCVYAQQSRADNAIQVTVDGVCEMCKARIEKAALQTKGVKSAEWDVESHQLTAVFNPKRFDEAALHQNIAAVGHDTEKVTAPDEAYAQLHDCCQYREAAVRQAHGQEAAENTVQFRVDGVCEMCKARIEKAALQTKGVESAEWNVESHQLTAVFDPEKFEVSALHQNIAGVGHDTDKVTASDEAYEQLHDCCKYRDAAVIVRHAPKSETVDENIVQGLVLQQKEGGMVEPLIGVNIFWLGTSKGTATDEQGRFELKQPAGAAQLVASYIGFGADTIAVVGENYVEVLLSDTYTLEAVEVTHRQKSTTYSFLAPAKVQIINEDELLKAACCNLSESFETNPSVDVSFTDAVTGTRQIQMLGLAGPYVQITRENMPDIRGLSAIHGLTYMPGPWMEGLQLIKGVGSVVNGYEAIAGQINLELRKPEKDEPVYLNVYANEGGRFEGNLTANHSLSDRWHTGLLLHGKTQQARMDRNDDGFLDNPLGEELYAVNRWKYTGANGLNAQFGIRGTYLDNRSGQLRFDPDDDRGSTQFWGADMVTRRMEGWAKMGRVFPDKPYASVGLQVSGFYHDQNAYFGTRPYDADQRMAYANLIYQSIIDNTNHRFKTGLSFQYDNLREQMDTMTFDRNEIVPGAFFEYTFEPGEQFTAVGGVRADYHNNFGLFFTPRIHLRYAFNDLTVLRASAGRGQRTASIIAENIGALASARSLNVLSENPENPYGLNPEIAWNFGLNLTQGFQLFGQAAVFSLDAYHTRFEQQIVVDYDEDPRQLLFYNLDGESYSNSLQVQLDMELVPRLDLRLAYRFNDVQTTFLQGKLEKPFVARHRAFLNTAYETNDQWKFDLTVNWQGAKRIPSTAGNPAEFLLPERSPDFLLVNAQVSKRWGDKFELYTGVENLFNFRQDNPIVSSEDPFSPYFDASLVWGPVFGRMTYAGMRLYIN